MFLSIKKAKLILREQAGLSIISASAAVAALPQTPDGKRMKVKLADINRIITEANKPTPIIPSRQLAKVRDFSPKQKAQILAFANR